MRYILIGLNTLISGVLFSQSSITANFSSSGACGLMCFTDLSVSSPPNTTTGWNWSFPGGVPANSTFQNPCVVTYPPGTYSVTLIATNSNGDSDTSVQVIMTGGYPTAAFSSTPPCLGNSMFLTDGSIGPSGDPIASWSWLMPGGIPSSSSSTIVSTLYSTAGTHTVTLIVTTQQGCKDTIQQQVLVYNNPVANFTSTGNGCGPVCSINYYDLSTSTDGTIIGWNWTFPGGNSSTSTAQNPWILYPTSSTYTACLRVVTNYGCSDTTCQLSSVQSIKDNYGLSERIDIYPNPSNGKFHISVPVELLGSIRDGNMLELYNLVGTRINGYLSKYSKDEIDIDLSNMPNGIYFLKLKTDSGTATKKIVIAK